MKNIILLTLISGLLAGPGTLFSAEDASTTLQKALFEEEANQNLEAAIKGYQAVIQQTDEQRKLAATAVFRLGECYRKLGRTNEAAAQYQRILSQYTEQTTLANLSKQNLVGLGMPASGEKPTKLSSVPIPNQEEAEIQRVQRLLKDSPDLINAMDPDPNQRTPLQRAASSGNLKLAEFLITNGADVNFRAPYKFTALHYAVSAGHKSMVEFLLAHGANVNAKQGQGFTALHMAAENGHKAIAEVLLAKKADVNGTTDLNAPPNYQALNSDQIRATPLHLATLKGHQSMAELLLKSGADVNARNRSGRQALHLAASAGHYAMAELLLQHKADLNAADNEGLTSLHTAVNNDHAEVAELLLKNKAEPNSSSKNGFWTPLHTAVVHANRSIIELLLKHKANINAREKDGLAPLHVAITRLDQSTSARQQICELLLQKGADINAPASVYTRNQYGSSLEKGLTPLHLVVDTKDEDLLKIFLAHKPNLNAKDQYGTTPLHRAVRELDRLRMAELLLQAGADVNAESDTKATPLFLAIRSSKETVKLLLAHKANVNIFDNAGNTPLATAKALPVSPDPPGAQATRSSRDETIDLLLEAGANEALERLNRIEVTRRAEPLFAVFQRSNFTNNWNQFTLLEVMAKALVSGQDATPSPIHPGYGTPMPLPGVLAMPGAMPGPRPLGSFNPPRRPGQAGSTLVFPDLANVKITRWDLKTGHASEIATNVEMILQAEDRAKDVPLQWADSIEIPELDHKTTEQWQGLTVEQSSALRELLKREVTIIVKGESSRRTLVPFFKTTLYRAQDGNLTFREDSTGPKPPETINSFWLKTVLTGSGLLRTSSDTTRIKIKRASEKGEPREITVNLDKVEGPENDFWLRDGDVIEVPER